LVVAVLAVLAFAGKVIAVIAREEAGQCAARPAWSLPAAVVAQTQQHARSRGRVEVAGAPRPLVEDLGERRRSKAVSTTKLPVLGVPTPKPGCVSLA
jgi:hypothetical protein